MKDNTKRESHAKSQLPHSSYYLRNRTLERSVKERYQISEEV